MVRGVIGSARRGSVRRGAAALPRGTHTGMHHAGAMGSRNDLELVAGGENR